MEISLFLIEVNVFMPLQLINRATLFNFSIKYVVVEDARVVPLH